MTGKSFMNSVANAERDILQVLLNILTETRSAYCVVGGLAVNAYAEPVVSLDLDIVVASQDIEKVVSAAENQGLKAERFDHSINPTSSESALRIRLQRDARYQAFIPHAEDKEILGYRMQVADVGDVLQGKVWAYEDKQRRRSKRQKDLADIMRLVERIPSLAKRLPPEIREQLE